MNQVADQEAALTEESFDKADLEEGDHQSINWGKIEESNEKHPNSALLK